MKLKIVEIEGKPYAAVDDKGLPVYVHDNGQEIGFDAVGTTSRIGSLNREAQQRREALEALEAKYKPYEGIENPDDVFNALKTVKNLQQGELKTAQQVEEIKQAAQKTAEEQVQNEARRSAQLIQDLTAERDKTRSQLVDHMVGGAFSGSRFVTEKLTLPPDIARKSFGEHFRVEEGRIVPYGNDGQKIYSRSRPGEVATFEEGIEFLVDSHPHRASILRGVGVSGTGATHGAGQGAAATQGGKPVMGRKAWDALPAGEKSAAVKQYTIVDDQAA